MQLTTSQILSLIDSERIATNTASAGNDSDCAIRLQEIAPKRRVQLLLAERGLYTSRRSDFAKLEAVLERNPILRRALKWLEPTNGGLGIVDQLVQPGTQMHRQAWSALELRIHTLRKEIAKSLPVTENQ